MYHYKKIIIFEDWICSGLLDQCCQDRDLDRWSYDILRRKQVGSWGGSERSGDLWVRSEISRPPWLDPLKKTWKLNPNKTRNSNLKTLISKLYFQNPSVLVTVHAFVRVVARTVAPLLVLSLAPPFVRCRSHHCSLSYRATTQLLAILWLIFFTDKKKHK